MSIQLLTAVDAAKKLGYSRFGLYKATQRFGIPHIRIGTLIRYDEADLDRFIEMLKSRSERCPTCAQSVRRLRIARRPA